MGMHGPTSGSIWTSMGPLPTPRLPNTSLSALPEIPLGHCHLLSPPSSLSFAHTAGSFRLSDSFSNFPICSFFVFFSLFSESVIPPIPRGSCFCMELQRLIQSSFDLFFFFAYPQACIHGDPVFPFFFSSSFSVFNESVFPSALFRYPILYTPTICFSLSSTICDILQFPTAPQASVICYRNIAPHVPYQICQ